MLWLSAVFLSTRQPSSLAGCTWVIWPFPRTTGIPAIATPPWSGSPGDRPIAFNSSHWSFGRCRALGAFEIIFFGVQFVAALPVVFNECQNGDSLKDCTCCVFDCGCDCD